MTQAEFSFDPQRPLSRMEQRFRDFHAANPRVYELFKQFTLQAISAGRTRYSADAICHRIRWHVEIETRSSDGFKINDHFSAAYARLYIDEFPEHANVFQIRSSVFDAAIGTPTT